MMLKENSEDSQLVVLYQEIAIKGHVYVSECCCVLMLFLHLLH